MNLCATLAFSLSIVRFLEITNTESMKSESEILQTTAVWAEFYSLNFMSKQAHLY